MRKKTNKTTAPAAFSYEDNSTGQTPREQLETSAAHIFDLGRLMMAFGNKSPGSLRRNLQ